MDFWEMLQASLREDVDKASLKKSYEEFKAQAGTENLKGLIDKNNELLGETKAAKQQFRELKDKYQIFEDEEVTSETYLAMKNQLAAFDNSGSGDLDEKLKAQYEHGKKAKEDELRPLLERQKAEQEKISKIAQDYQSRYQDFRARGELKSAIDKMGLDVDDFWFEGMMNKSKIEFNDEDKMSIGIYHDGGHVPLEDWVKIFPDTEQGKKYRKAALNSGGGASGSNASGHGATLEDIRSGKLSGDQIDAYLTANGIA